VIAALREVGGEGNGGFLTAAPVTIPGGGTLSPLPTRDALGNSLVGLEKVRVYYLPLAFTRPTGEEVLSRGRVVLERTRPNLPDPGSTLLMDLHQIGRPAGWLVAVAVRVGDVLGEPSDPLPWLDPAI